MSRPDSPQSSTFVGNSTGANVGIITVFGAIGGGLGFAIIRLLDLLLGLKWVPFQGPLELINSIPAVIALPVMIGVGLIAGLVFGVMAVREELSVTVTAAEVNLKRGGFDRTISRSAVATVFRDRKELVLLGADTNELAREKIDQPTDKLSTAFAAHGYPWRAEGDPQRDDFRVWSPQTVGLPVGASALLTVRAKALSDDKTDEARNYRDELARLGIVVKDEGGKQYWRRVPGLLEEGPDR